MFIQSKSGSKEFGNTPLSCTASKSGLVNNPRSSVGVVSKLEKYAMKNLTKIGRVIVNRKQIGSRHLLIALKQNLAEEFFSWNRRQTKLNPTKIIPGHKSIQPISAKGIMPFTLIKRIVTEWYINSQPGIIKIYPTLERLRLIFESVSGDRFCRANNIKILHAQIIIARGLRI